MEPNWDELGARLRRLSVKQLRVLGKRWFNGALGGESTKDGIIRAMVAQMRHWWRSCAEWGGRDRVEHVLHDLDEGIYVSIG